MIYICCVGFVSLDVVYDELKSVPGTLVYSSFLISVCFAQIECYSDCSYRGAIWLNPFATVLFTVCSTVTVECFVLYPCCVGVFAIM